MYIQLWSIITKKIIIVCESKTINYERKGKIYSVLCEGECAIYTWQMKQVYKSTKQSVSNIWNELIYKIIALKLSKFSLKLETV